MNFHGLLSPWRLEAKLNAMMMSQESAMSLIDDIRAGMATAEDDEAKLIAALQAAIKSNQDLSTRLTAALATNDPTALQTIVNQLNADNAAMQAAIDSVPKPEAAAEDTVSAGTVGS